MAMTLGQLADIVNGLIKIHGETIDVRFLYQFASGRTKADTVTNYEVRTPKGEILKGAVTFRIGYARGEEEK